MFSILGNIKSWLLVAGSPLWRIWLRINGATIGRRLIVIGRPGINRKRRTLIHIGDEVVLCSSPLANPLTEGGRCRLATVAQRAELIIHSRVGLSSTIICCAERIEIGSGTIVGAGTLIIDTDFHPRSEDGSWLTNPAAVAKPVTIGSNCFIGAKSIILKGVSIGDGAVVGAGAVVSRDVPAGVTVVGNPATKISP